METVGDWVTFLFAISLIFGGGYVVGWAVNTKD